jgi:hypothetical protein
MAADRMVRENEKTLGNELRYTDEMRRKNSRCGTT